MTVQATPTKATPKIEFVDSLRGLACILVVIAHLVVTLPALPQLMVHLTGIVQEPVAAKPIASFYRHSPINLGGFGVSLFFIISGFVIPLSIMRVDRVSFAITRVFRIYPTYLASLAFLVFGLTAVRAYFGMTYQVEWRSMMLHAAIVRDFFWMPSLDGICWTLEIELKFYLLCLIIAPLLIKADVPGILLISAAMTGICVWTGSVPDSLAGTNFHLFAFLKTINNFTLFVNFMWIGAILCFHWHGRCSTSLAAFSTCFLSAMFWLAMVAGDSLVTNLGSLTRLIASYQGAVGFFLLAYRFPSWFTGRKSLSFLAKISYPLYVVHGVVGYGVEQVLLHLGVNIYLAIALTVALMIGVATAVHYYVEAPSHQFGRWLARRWQSATGLTRKVGPETPPPATIPFQVPAPVAA